LLLFLKLLLYFSDALVEVGLPPWRMRAARVATLRKIEIVKLPILTKALVVLLAASYVQERLITEVCAQESWDFECGYKHVNQDNAEDYLFETSNTRIYSERHDPPVTYWGPSANDVVGTITYKFEFDRPTEKIHLKASIASFNFPQPGYGGTGKGETSLWASIDNAEWVELVYNPLPFGVDSYVTYDELLPESLAGESVIYIQALIEVWESALGAYTTAQFSRSSSAADEDIFKIKVMLGPEPKTVGTTVNVSVDNEGLVTIYLQTKTDGLWMIEASSDLKEWSEVNTVETANGEAEATDIRSLTNKKRFYRARLLQ